MKYKKILAVGDGNVGKTSLLITYTTNVCPEEWIPTGLEILSKQILINDEEIVLNLWDLCGVDCEDKRVRESIFYVQTDVFLVCFSIDNKQSLKNAQNKWIPEINNECPNIPFILVGMKSDLRDQDLKSRSYLIPIHVAESVAQKAGARCYIECSSKNGNNLDRVFECVAKIVLNIQDELIEQNKPNDKSCGIIYYTSLKFFSNGQILVQL